MKNLSDEQNVSQMVCVPQQLVVRSVVSPVHAVETAQSLAP